MGRVTFAPSGIPFDVRGDGGVFRTASLNFAPSLFEPLTEGLEWDNQSLYACIDVFGTSIERLLTQLVREATAPGFASDTLLEAAGRMAAVELIRFLRTPRDEELESRLFSMTELGAIEEIIASEERVSLVSIASRCGIGVRTLTRVFKATTGRTIGDVVAQHRLQRAMTLLKDNAVPLKVIAYRAGFGSPSTFSTAFRQSTGMTPRSYRQSFSAFASEPKSGFRQFWRDDP